MKTIALPSIRNAHAHAMAPLHTFLSCTMANIPHPLSALQARPAPKLFMAPQANAPLPHALQQATN